jgi:hypothetical protein
MSIVCSECKEACQGGCPCWCHGNPEASGHNQDTPELLDCCSEELKHLFGEASEHVGRHFRKFPDIN